MSDATAGSTGSDTPQAPRNHRRARLIGFAILLLGFGGFLGWAMTADLEGAAVAQGELQTTTSLQAVEHRDGGIVEDIDFSSGDQVSEGDVLVVLDDTQLRAELATVRSQYASTRAELERLEAEQVGDTVFVQPPAPPGETAELTEDYDEALRTQQAIFEQRREAFEGQLAQLDEQVRALQVQRDGVESQIESREATRASYAEELAEVEDLVSEQLAEVDRQRELERQILQIDGEIADLESQIDEIDVQIAETRLEMTQVRNERNLEIAERLSEVRDRFNDLDERRRALADQVARTTLRAPAAGTVVDKSLHTEGAVLEPGERVADIVPHGEDLVVEARVSPQDIDRVAVGQQADVRLSAYSFRTTPVVVGEVIHVSADALEDEQNGESYYLTRIQLNEESLNEALGNEELLPGMPAEVMILTGQRTFFEYLIKPVSDALARAFRES